MMRVGIVYFFLIAKVTAVAYGNIPETQMMFGALPLRQLLQMQHKETASGPKATGPVPADFWKHEEKELIAQWASLDDVQTERPAICFEQLPENVTCGSPRVEGDGTFLRSTSGTCDWCNMDGQWEGENWNAHFKSSQDCPRFTSRGDFMAKNVQKRKYWFMGGLTTRHYASTLSKLLQGLDTSDPGHRLEQNQCEESALSDCDFGDKVRFLWKHAISTKKGKSADKDGVRKNKDHDACSRYETTEQCLTENFKGATKDDVLVMGSIFGDGSFMDQVHGKMSAAQAGPQYMKGAIENDNPGTVDMILHAFPGAVIFHSYPAINQKPYEKKAAKEGRKQSAATPWDLNVCYRDLAKIEKCAIKTAIERKGRRAMKSPRAAFIDLFPIQQSKFDLYSDAIHHPGKLSEEVLEHMFGMLPEQ